jgi:phosphomannomutase
LHKAFASYSVTKTAGKLAMVASTVSSKMIEAMAQHEGFKFVECLTGKLPDIDKVRNISMSKFL